MSPLLSRRRAAVPAWRGAFSPEARHRAVLADGCHLAPRDRTPALANSERPVTAAKVLVVCAWLCILAAVVAGDRSRLVAGIALITSATFLSGALAAGWRIKW